MTDLMVISLAVLIILGFLCALLPARMRINAEINILSVLRDGPLSSAKLGEHTRLGPARMYPALFRLEESGKIISHFADGPEPRRRIYRIK